MASGRVVVRADGDAAIGLGHVMRCLALADRLIERGASVTFVTRSGEPAVLDRIAAQGCAVVPLPRRDDRAADLDALLKQAAVTGATAAVVDVQGVDRPSQAAIRAAGLRLTVIDDLAHSFVADVVLNQNLGAEPAAYRVEPHTRLLLGPRYALLRRAFTGRRATPAGGPPRVLLTMGGGDGDNVTLRALREADALEADFALDVLLGPAFPHGESVSAAARSARHPVRIHRDPPDVPGLMAGATLALSAAGSTCWELAHLGLPAVLLVLADNQEAVAAGLHAAGFAISLGEAGGDFGPALREALGGLLADATRRSAMAAVGRRLVDGEGAARVAAAVMAA
jgi:UDP-2,4-diacetamido-2,4,6-trideoxy-beta-L-altropyranose hydrolase